jgi:hypothetical protein
MITVRKKVDTANSRQTKKYPAKAGHLLSNLKVLVHPIGKLFKLYGSS